MKYIKFAIYGGERSPDGTTSKATIRKPESNMPREAVNEVNIMLNALARTVRLIKENDGFPYTLPFELD